MGTVATRISQAKKLENITEDIMDKVHKDELKIRPKLYFVIGSLMTFIGLFS